MSAFLRDETLSNVSFNEDALKKINESLLEVDGGKEEELSPSYVIRFENKGIRFSDFDNMLKHFKNAKNVERVVFYLNSSKSRNSNLLEGKSIELRLDSGNIYNCMLIVQDDDFKWVNANFLKIQEVLKGYKNKNWLIRNGFTSFMVQIVGVVLGLLICLWAAIKVTPLLAIQNAFAFAFIAFLILFSNIWTYIYSIIMKSIDYIWPNLLFKESPIRGPFVKSLLIAGAVAVISTVVYRLYLFLDVILKTILK